MASNEDLKKKLLVGKNQSSTGFDSYAKAQLLDAVSREQYAGQEIPPQVFGSSRDTLNP